MNKKFLLKYVSSQISQIENRNKNYLSSKKWQNLKRVEQRLYRELQSEEMEK